LDRTFIDTFFIVALVNVRDFYHEKALELSVEYEGKSLITTDAILLEISNSLSKNYKTESIIIIEKLLLSFEIEIIRLDESLFEKAFSLYKSHADKTWGLVDCISFIVMKEQNIQNALTCDKHFLQAGLNPLMLEKSN
jgi:uncharacterized protein